MKYIVTKDGRVVDVSLMQECETDDDNLVRETLMQVVPTYKTPEEINSSTESVDKISK